MKSILLTGGARSGKSIMAQELAVKTGGSVLFVATAEAGDDEMQERIEKHRQARPSEWGILEATSNLGSQITRHRGGIKTIIIDCITLLVSNVLGQCGEKASPAAIEKAVTAEIDELIKCIKKTKADFIIVTNEVGMGIVPADRTTRLYRDLLGKANQMLAASVDEVYLLASGIPIRLK